MTDKPDRPPDAVARARPYMDVFEYRTGLVPVDKFEDKLNEGGTQGWDLCGWTIQPGRVVGGPPLIQFVMKKRYMVVSVSRPDGSPLPDEALDGMISGQPVKDKPN